MGKTTEAERTPFPFAILVFGAALVVTVWTAVGVAGPLTDKGTQPPISIALRPPSTCDGCHGDYDQANHIEPFPTWAGSMMGQAGRDPLFWAALDVANNDLPGVGEFCIRCHSPNGWLEGRSEPPNGSEDGCQLEGKLDEPDRDFSGVDCHFCHRMMENQTPPPGEQSFYLENGQFWIEDEGCNGGGGQPCRRGPYNHPQDGTDEPPHPWIQSDYHEESRICGNCHNVTNPVLNLMEGGVDTGIPFPIERTYNEWAASDFATPASADFKTCQNCHMPDATVDPAHACDQQRNNHTGDLPIHDFAGGNAWIPDVLSQEYPNLDRAAELIASRDAALDLLQNQSATVNVTAPASVTAGGNLTVQVRVTNLTGHKLPTGYPEGRRMWVRVVARDGNSSPIFTSGGYNSSNGTLVHDPQIKVYETKVGIWNRNGTNACDVADTGGNPLFHFVLNNCILEDNRIPPKGFTGGTDPELQPVNYTYPETSPGSGIMVNYDDTDYTIAVPLGTPGPITVNATLQYQTTSKEYVEFLRDQAIANNFPDDCTERSTGFLTESRGEYLYGLWQTYGRSAPVNMATGASTTTVGTGPSCGNGNVDPGETCDPPSSCPTSCDDGNACTNDTLTGSAANCDAACSFPPISACNNGDGCCPAGCDAASDDDCSASCGNGTVEPGETCDPPSTCPTTCDDGNACTNDMLTGSAANCDAACSFAPISACSNGDGCCPAGCDASSDDDCSASCGNSTVEPGETCDPPSSCPTSCDDGNACTNDTLTGSAANCSASCSFAPISACANGDGCCPVGCDAATDSDCSATCGDGVVDSGETCDPQSSCPTDCDDSNDCTVDSLTGSAANCNAACSYNTITECHAGDGCCAPGCDPQNDADCSATCGDGVLDTGETCDPPSSCPTTCDDADACTLDTLTGSAASCSAACNNTAIVSCNDGDGCCPGGCSASNDDDCAPTTDGGVTPPEAGLDGSAGAQDGGQEGGPVVTPASEDDGGCGCRTTPTHTPEGWFAGLLVAFALARRRQILP